MNIEVPTPMSKDVKNKRSGTYSDTTKICGVVKSFLIVRYFSLSSIKKNTFIEKNCTLLDIRDKMRSSKRQIKYKIMKYVK